MMDQYSNMIRAITMFLTLFVGTWMYRSCQEKQSPPQIPIKEKIIYYDHKIRSFDSSIFVIPFRFSDSIRAEYLKNYTKQRKSLHR